MAFRMEELVALVVFRRERRAIYRPVGRYIDAG
jgi:hypothetical protein